MDRKELSFLVGGKRTGPKVRNAPVHVDLYGYETFRHVYGVRAKKVAEPRPLKVPLAIVIMTGMRKGVCAMLCILHSTQAFAPLVAPCRLAHAQTRAPQRPPSLAMSELLPPLGQLPFNLGGFFQRFKGGGVGWAGPLGVRRAELKAQLAQAVELKQGRYFA